MLTKNGPGSAAVATCSALDANGSSPCALCSPGLGLQPGPQPLPPPPPPHTPPRSPGRLGISQSPGCLWPFRSPFPDCGGCRGREMGAQSCLSAACRFHPPAVALQDVSFLSFLRPRVGWAPQSRLAAPHFLGHLAGAPHLLRLKEQMRARAHKRWGKAALGKVSLQPIKSPLNLTLKTVALDLQGSCVPRAAPAPPAVPLREGVGCNGGISPKDRRSSQRSPRTRMQPCTG